MKKIKFPLEMAKGKMVRELDEFQEYFDLQRAVEYFYNGKLQKWLENTYNDDILEELEELTGQETDFVKRFTEILGVDYQEQPIDIKQMMDQAQLKEKLKRILPEDEVEEAVESSADTQEKLEELIKSGVKKVYLLSGTYRIPRQAEGILFIGLGEPSVEIEENDQKKFQQQGLQFRDVKPENEESRKLMSLSEIAALMLECLDLLQLQLERI